MSGCARDKQQVVAEVSGEGITDKQFAERYSQYLSSTDQRDNVVLRQQVLNNMINEVLIQRDIRRQGFDRDEQYRAKMQSLWTQALLDGYARRIISDTLNIPEEELHKEFRSYNSKVAARYLYAKSDTGARILKARLEDGATFEELARDVFEDPGLANNGGSLGTFGWGEMEPPLEAAAFSLPVGSLSEPIRMSMGYAIVRVDQRRENPLVSESDYMKVREKLRRAAVDKRVAELIKQELANIEKELAPSFYEQSVQAVFAGWNHVVDHPASGQSEVQFVRNKDISTMKLVAFKVESWNVEEFVQRLKNTTERQKRRVRKPEDVKDMAIGLATREVLLKKARMAGLDSDSLVLATVNKAREMYLLKRWGASLIDTVGNSGWNEQELRRHFDQTKAERVHPPEVNVGEILVRTEYEARRILLRLKQGARFDDLARKNSIRLWAAKRGGELGFGTEASFGPMGKKFLTAKQGDIIGPQSVDPYFGIFKVLEKKPGRPMTFEESKDQIIGEVRQRLQMEVRQKVLASLHKGVSISVNNELLANIVLN